MAGPATAQVPAATSSLVPAAAPGLPHVAASTTPGARGWSLIGASIPYRSWRCDFGCSGAGVRDSERAFDSMFRTMSQRGVRVVRWYLFPGDAWQIDRSSMAVSAAARADLSRAVQLAEKHDVYLLPAFLPNPDQVPAAWFTDPGSRAALAGAFQSVVSATGGSSHVLGWEVATGAEGLVTGAPGAPTSADVRATTQALAAAVHGTSRQLAIVGVGSSAAMPQVQGLGADAYGLMAGNALTTALPLTPDAPVFLSQLAVSSPAQMSSQLATAAAQGYAGALAWSWTSARSTFDSAVWRWHYAHADSGPRARALNPCIGPNVGRYRCPNLKVSKPSNFSLAKRGKRTVLLSRSSINNLGTGPASLRGTRNGTYTMRAVQLLHRKHGKPWAIATGARLKFKAIPHQARYWKWNGAARMELWRLDASGAPVERVEVGPKTVYCLRDLKRTKPRKGSPKNAKYPGCSQNPKAKRVTLGTSVGWSDIYPASYFENWVDVTGLRGCFAYVHIVDPENVIFESNENDNVSTSVVRLPWNPKVGNRGCPGARPLLTVGDGGIY